MSKILCDVWRLMRPLVGVRCRVEEVDICVDKEEDSTIMFIMLDKTLDGEGVPGAVWVRPVGRGPPQDVEVCFVSRCDGCGVG